MIDGRMGLPSVWCRKGLAGQAELIASGVASSEMEQSTLWQCIITFRSLQVSRRLPRIRTAMFGAPTTGLAIVAEPSFGSASGGTFASLFARAC